jgi:NitT/TauT family transport system ATP-binding protein
MLEVRIDRKAFGANQTIIHDTAFAIEAGEVVALLGPSGAGKTTLLRILLGLEQSFEGRVRSRHRRVGVMFQEPRLLPWLTVTENLRLVVTGAMPPPDTESLLASVQLQDAGSLYPAQLSLGMARRVALVRALAVSPDFVVLDEPFASVDAQLGAILADAITRYACATGATVILATHDLAPVLNRVSRFLILAGCPTTLCADRPASSTSQASLLRDFPFLRSESNKDQHLLSSPKPRYCHQNNS